MDRFLILRLILRHGRLGAMVLSLACALIVPLLAWSSLGWFALITAPPTLLVSYVLLKSYVEIVQIISEMAH